jgi:cytoskeleton protein RodZ
MGDFGDKFRKAREKKELSLDDVSNVTKINARMLRAIEEEHFDDLPGGVFNKGFIRAYAKHLGLDAEEAVTDYLASLRQAQINANDIWESKLSVGTRPGSNGGTSPAPETKKAAPPPVAKPPVAVRAEELPDLQLPRAEDVRSSRKEFLGYKPTSVPWKIVAAAALVVALAMFLWIRHSKRMRAGMAPPTHVVPAAVTPSIPTPANASQPISSPASAPEKPPASPKTAASPDAAPPPLTAQNPVQGGENAAPATTSTAPAPAPKADNSSDVTVKPSAKPASKATQKTVPMFSLVIRANENSWISVTSDGQLVTQETLIAPAQTTVRGSREISVRVGNAAGVSFLLNGKEVRAQGAEAEVKNFVFDANGLRDSSAAGVP